MYVSYEYIRVGLLVYFARVIMDTKPQDFEIISANIDQNEVQKLIEENYDIIPENLCQLNGYDDLNFRIIPPIKMKTDNRHTKLCQNGYVLKIINWKDSMNVEFMTEYVNILIHLRNHQITCPNPVKNNKGEYTTHWSKGNYNFESSKDNEGVSSQPSQRVHTVLLFEFLIGDLLEGSEISEKLCFSMGQLIGQLHTALKPFCGSKALQRPHFVWSLKYAPDVLQYMNAVDDKVKRTMTTTALKEFKEKVLTRLDELEQGIIHGDINKSNLLVSNKGENNEEICGVLDFCDMIHSSYLFEIAVACTYLTMDDIDRLEDIIASIILGYRRKLTELEFSLLKICICARLSQSLVLGLHTFKLHPTNNYVLSSQKQGWPLLEKLINTDNEQFIGKIKEKIAYYSLKFSQ